MTDAFIHIHNLSKTYQEGDSQRTVLQQLQAEIQQGEIIILLGRSGSGKSTFLNLLAGIDLPSQGAIRIDGVTLTSLTERKRTWFRRQHIGFVFQFFNLIPTLTVEENLLLPLELNMPRFQIDRKAAHPLLHQLGLGDRGQSFPDRLSGGEQQRVAIARALIHNPKLILADEPTGNLDAETSGVVLDLLHHLIRDAGKTMIIATHSEDVAHIGDRVFAIRDGSLQEQ